MAFRHRQQNRLYPFGYGYVVIPDRVNRDEYIETCFRKGVVSLVAYNGGNFMKDCNISKTALKEVVFPKDSETFGSCVCFGTEPVNNLPTVIGVLFKGAEGSLLSEGDFDIGKTYEKNNVSVSGSAKEATLNINVNDFDDVGVLNINVVGGNGGKINITAKTDINIKSNNKVSIDTFNEIELKTLNTNTDEETKINISKDGKIVSSGKEQVLLDGEDYAVRYSETEKAYNQLKTDFSNFVSVFNAHIHITTATVGATAVPGTIAPTATPAQPSTGDITLAKVETVRLP